MPEEYRRNKESRIEFTIPLYMVIDIIAILRQFKFKSPILVQVRRQIILFVYESEAKN